MRLLISLRGQVGDASSGEKISSFETVLGSPRACPDSTALLSSLKTWADAQLRIHRDKLKQPQPIRFVIHTEGGAFELATSISSKGSIVSADIELYQSLS
jgi:hypothetical protein